MVQVPPSSSDSFIQAAVVIAAIREERINNNYLSQKMKTVKAFSAAELKQELGNATMSVRNKMGER